ncbi:MAG: ComEC/Rec2 family competence protein [Alphaproteobacteria bacterium]
MNTILCYTVGMKEKIKNLFYLERSGFALLWGAFFALGIGIYFALPVEPDWRTMTLAAFVSAVVWIVGRRDVVARTILGYVMMVCLGLCVATIRTAYVAAPVLDTPLFEVGVSGTIAKVEPRATGQRITLENVYVEGLTEKQTPHFIRLNYHQKEPVMRVGDRLSGVAHLVPPMSPVTAGAYDFARAAWFMQLGATGKLLKMTDYVKTGMRSALMIRFEDMRAFITARVREVLPPQSASIAVPLIIGDQGLVTSDMYDLYRIAGIIHVLSVSGYHLTLLAGLVFFFIRGAFALYPALGEKINTKKVSAFLSLMIVLFYLFLSGLQIPAVRSFLMISIVLIGVMFDRNAISLRNAVLAGMFILLFWPESLISASFQLSFMAVFAMLSLYETLMRVFQNSPYRQWWYKIWLIFVGMVCVGLLASVATAPYAAYHYNQYATYSILGNLATEFLFSFAIMPLLLVAVLLMPLGWDAPFLKGAGYCLDKITDICRWITTLPYADVTVPAFDGWGLALVSTGLILIFFFTTKVRWIGLVFVLCAIGSFLTVPKPDVIIADGGKAYAMRRSDGLLQISNPTVMSIATDVWLKRNGQNPKFYDFPPLTDKAVIIKSKKIAFDSLACADADLSVLSSYGLGDCPTPVLYPADLHNGKTYMIFVENNRIRIECVTDILGDRPWTHFLLAKQKKSDYINH